MEKQENNHRVKYTKIACLVLVVLLCAVPCKALYVYNQTVNIDYGIANLTVFMGTANLYPGAIVDNLILAQSGSEINFYGGQLVTGYILAFGGTSMPKITVYGRNFAINGTPCDPSVTSFNLSFGSYPVLTGFYDNGDPINLTFYGNIPINLVTLASEDMEIDIKPGDEQNNINLNSKGVVPVAVLTSTQFDAVSIDPATARFAGAAPAHWSFEDVDGDGDDDIIFHFKTQLLDLNQDSTEATLTAQTAQPAGTMTIKSMATVSSGSTVTGTDEVRIVSSKEKSKK